MLRSAQPSQFSTYPSQYIDTPVLAVLIFEPFSIFLSSNSSGGANLSVTGRPPKKLGLNVWAVSAKRKSKIFQLVFEAGLTKSLKHSQGAVEGWTVDSGQRMIIYNIYAGRMFCARTRSPRLRVLPRVIVIIVFNGLPFVIR